MDRPYRYIEVDRQADVFCVHLTNRRLDESQVIELADELLHLITEGGCRKLALSLGPGSPEFIYSVFLAKLITVQRVLGEHGGQMVLCELSEPVHDIFEACRLDSRFHFVPDIPAAVAFLNRVPT
jgi:anti-anti-sigma factor